MGKTIKQLADEFGVSKTAIRKYMSPEFREQHTTTGSGNIIEIDDDGCALLAKTMHRDTETGPEIPPETSANSPPETTENERLREEVAFLRSQMEAKDRQIEAQNKHLEEKDRQIQTLQGTLDRTLESLLAAQEELSVAQRLHAGTIQMQLQPGPQDAPAAPEEPPEAAQVGEPEQPARRTWWQRIFGI